MTRSEAIARAAQWLEARVEKAEAELREVSHTLARSEQDGDQLRTQLRDYRERLDVALADAAKEAQRIVAYNCDLAAKTLDATAASHDAQTKLFTTRDMWEQRADAMRQVSFDIRATRDYSRIVDKVKTAHGAAPADFTNGLCSGCGEPTPCPHGEPTPTLMDRINAADPPGTGDAT